MAEPAYFLSLELENVRCFGPRQRLDLSDADGAPAMWTVLLGENGVGKTTLLQVVAGLAPFPDPKLGVDIRISDLLPLLERGDAALTGKEFDVRASRRSASLPGLREYVPTFAYGASRGAAARSFDDSTPPSDDTTTLFDPGALLVPAEEWLQRLDYASLAEQRVGAHEARLTLVKRLLVDILPDVDDIDVVPAKGVRYHTAYGWVASRALSMGYQTMIAWTVDLAWRLVRRYPDSPNPLAEPAVVLVDEIDLHLHPRWQRDLMGFLRARFPRTQFIVTAHSPLAVLAAGPANVAVLRREGDHVVIDNDPHLVRTWRVDQLLTSDLFGLPSARAPDVELLLAERARLLSKRRLSAADKARVADLEAQLGDIPSGERAEDREAMRIIREAAAALATSPR